MEGYQYNTDPEYAWIENGVVVNIIACTHENLPPKDDYPDALFVLLENHDEYGIGDFYEDGVFTKAPVVEPPPPEPTEIDIVNEKINQINYLTDIQNGVI